MKPRLFLTATALLLAAPAALAAVFTETYTFPVAAPAGNVSDTGIPLTLTQTIAGSAITSLTEVRVGLQLQGTTAGGGWAGDMFVSLNRAGSITSILLNQAGVSADDPVGSGFDGWNITFRDSAPNGDIHLGQPAGPATILTGEWQPDGRQAATDTARPALLAAFNSVPANADWHLTLADLNPEGIMSLLSWSLTFTGTDLTPVPEPEAYAALSGLALAGFALWRKRNGAMKQ
jgi:subtilisin-like proprotein convertase family protein